MQNALVEVQDVVKHFPVGKEFLRKSTRFVHALDGVSLSVQTGETFGAAGESGCGKTTLGRTALALTKPTAGTVVFDGQDLFALDKEQLRKLRRDMQMVCQDPVGALDPRQMVFDIIAEPLRTHTALKGEELDENVAGLLERVGLSPDHARRYPHEFSGGQRQRIGISRALALNPKFIVLDEPTSSLDVSVQAQILNLLKELQAQFGLTYLFISHNLGVIRHMCTRLAIMYLGKIVESGHDADIFQNAAHPYTIALLSSIPKSSPLSEKKRAVLAGEVPSPVNPPSGCRFRTRCRFVREVCSKDDPQLVETTTGHYVACHLLSGS